MKEKKYKREVLSDDYYDDIDSSNYEDRGMPFFAIFAVLGYYAIKMFEGLIVSVLSGLFLFYFANITSIILPSFLIFAGYVIISLLTSNALHLSSMIDILQNFLSAADDDIMYLHDDSGEIGSISYFYDGYKITKHNTGYFSYDIDKCGSYISNSIFKLSNYYDSITMAFGNVYHEPSYIEYKSPLMVIYIRCLISYTFHKIVTR